MTEPNHKLLDRLLRAEERLGLNSRDLIDHAKTLTAHNDELSKLIQWRFNSDVLMAREEERDKSLYRRLGEIEASIEDSRKESAAGIREIKGTWARVQWIIITAVVIAFAAFVLKGGLA